MQHFPTFAIYYSRMDTKQNLSIEKCKQGDTGAQTALYKQYAPLLLGVCRRYINNRMQAEDVLHESFITIFEKITDLKDVNSIEGWMKRIVINNSLKFLKHREHFSDIDEINESEIVGGNHDNQPEMKDELLQSVISQEEMLEVINGLPTGFRTVFNLYVFEKYDHNEIAQELGISASTSRSQLVRSRKMIQKRLVELVEKNKKDKKERVYLSSFLLLMNDDSSFFDQIAFAKLNGYQVDPISIPSFLNNTQNELVKAGTQGVMGKMAILVGKKFIWVTALFVGVAGFSLFVLLPEKEQPIQTKNEEQVAPNERSLPVAIPDTASFAPTISATDTNETQASPILKKKVIPVVHDSIKGKAVVHRKVVVKKVIRVKKDAFVADTIRKKDTLEVE
jgi:RNA polymerase sigma factor (sigma-70 family)